MPFWQSVLGPFLAVAWLIGVIAVQMRLQFELYEMLLTEALGQSGDCAAQKQGSGASCRNGVIDLN